MTQQQPEQVIATPVGGNLDQELTQAKRGLGKVTIGLGIGVLVLVAFFGGIWVHSATAGTSSAPAAQAPRGQGLGAGRVPPSGAPGAGGSRGGTAGTVERVEGTTVIVKTQGGAEVRVSTTDSTRVEVAQAGKLSDLTPGSSVLVQGQRAEDSSVQAQAITKRPAP